MSMPQVRIHGVDDVRVDNVEKPTPGPGDILVRVELCGICGSDLGYIGMGGLGMSGLDMTRPMPLGHELVGVVAETGDDVRNVQPGQRVVVNPVAAGNNIGNGGPEGGFAPLLLVRGAAANADAFYPVPESLSTEQAALVEPLAVALHGCHQGQVNPDDKAVVLGAGPIGLCTVACLKSLGVENVVVVDLSDFRLEAAARLGAVPFNPGSGELVDFLLAQQGQAEVLGMPVPATDIYFEATGSRPVFEQVLNSARAGARVVVLGLHKKPVPMDLTNLLFRELHLIGSMAYPDEFPRVIEMLAGGELDTSALVSHRFPLSRFDEALDQARNASAATKVLVDCQA